VTLRLEVEELLPKDGARLVVLATRGTDIVAKGEATVKLPKWGLRPPGAARGER
jgi:hypothetical protein